MPESEKPDAEKTAPAARGKNGGARPGAGRKPFVPTDEERKQVAALAGFGLPQEHIAVMVRGGIDTGTLAKHFAPELILGKAKANAKIGQTLFQQAIRGDTSAMIWWSKSQMGWRETQRREHSGPDGGPLEIAKGRKIEIIRSYAQPLAPENDSSE